MCSVKTVFLEILQKSQEITCAKAFVKERLLIKKEALVFQKLWSVFLWILWNLYKNTFSHRTPLVAASESFEISGRWKEKLCWFRITEAATRVFL